MPWVAHHGVGVVMSSHSGDVQRRIRKKHRLDPHITISPHILGRLKCRIRCHRHLRAWGLVAEAQISAHAETALDLSLGGLAYGGQQCFGRKFLCFTLRLSN
jgi:hypothetical protein